MTIHLAIKTGVLCFLLGVSTLPALSAQPLSAAEKKAYAGEIEGALLGLLDAYYPRAVDREKGGFYSTFTYDWKLTGNQDKMIVTQARHTWLPAKAAQVFPKKEYLPEAARHGYVFLRDAMWDDRYGGFYTWVTRDGKPRNPNDLKTAYGNTFGIFALAAYYQSSGDTAALNLAKKAFYWLEKFSHDPAQGGYFQHLQRDGAPAHLAGNGGKGMYGPLQYKDQNSSIHLLEAFTELYGVWPDPLVRDRVAEMLGLIRDRITTPRGHLTLFLRPDWQPVSYRDSSEAVRKANYALDHVSFGHDVETAYLMLEASHTLGLEADARTPLVAKRMVDHALQGGWDAATGGFFERGYYFKGAKGITIIDDRKNWWAQAEGLNTLLLMALKYPGDPMPYGARFRTQWQYIRRYLIDAGHGGWYEWGIDKDPAEKTGNKAHAWKAAYHDGRSLLNCLQYLRPDHTPPSAPAEVRIAAGASGAVTLHWKAATDDRQVRGYDVYYGDKRIGFTPLTRFTPDDPALRDRAHFRVIARDVQGNPSPAAAGVVK